MAYDPKLSWDGVAAALSGPGLGPALDDGFLYVYDDSDDVPAHADDDVGDCVLLAVLGFGDPAFGADVEGVMTAEAITSEDSALDTGTASFGRYVAADETVIFQGLCGTSASDFILSTEGEGGPLDIAEGMTVACASAILRMVRE